MPEPELEEIAAIGRQLNLELSTIFQELFWALGEVRINRVTPDASQFQEWKRQRDGLLQFWAFANSQLTVPLDQEDAHDIWRCIDLTLTKRIRRAFDFQDYLVIATRAGQKCDICGRRPPEVTLALTTFSLVRAVGLNRISISVFSVNFTISVAAIASVGQTFGGRCHER